LPESPVVSIRIAVLPAIALLLTILPAAPTAAQAQTHMAQAPATEFSAQSTQPRRVRPRVRVYREYQPPFWEYPRPGTYSWPGPGARRDCRAWYVLENRPSGPVMTPRMRCDWVPG
jgi:hypothetical protein